MFINFLQQSTYADVAAKISAFLAFVIRARAKEKTAENTTTIPSLRPLEWIKYRATTEEMGRIDETTVVSMSRISFNLFSL